MKKTKKIISLLLTIQMLFACTLVPSAIATDEVAESTVIEGEEIVVEFIEELSGLEELQPRIASAGCYSHVFDWSEDNQTLMDASIGAIMTYNNWTWGARTTNYPNQHSTIILQNGIRIGEFHEGHRQKLTNKIIQPHYHLDANKGHHYVVYD